LRCVGGVVRPGCPWSLGGVVCCPGEVWGGGVLCATADALAVDVTSGFPHASAQAITSALRPTPIAISCLIDRIVCSSAQGNLRAQEHVHPHDQTREC